MRRRLGIARPAEVAIAIGQILPSSVRHKFDDRYVPKMVASTLADMRTEPNWQQRENLWGHLTRRAEQLDGPRARTFIEQAFLAPEVPDEPEGELTRTFAIIANAAADLYARTGDERIAERFEQLVDQFSGPHFKDGPYQWSFRDGLIDAIGFLPPAHAAQLLGRLDASIERQWSQAIVGPSQRLKIAEAYYRSGNLDLALGCAMRMVCSGSLRAKKSEYLSVSLLRFLRMGFDPDDFTYNDLQELAPVVRDLAAGGSEDGRPDRLREVKHWDRLLGRYEKRTS